MLIKKKIGALCQYSCLLDKNRGNEQVKQLLLQETEHSVVVAAITGWGVMVLPKKAYTTFIDFVLQATPEEFQDLYETAGSVFSTLIKKGYTAQAAVHHPDGFLQSCGHFHFRVEMTSNISLLFGIPLKGEALDKWSTKMKKVFSLS